MDKNILPRNWISLKKISQIFHFSESFENKLEHLKEFMENRRLVNEYPNHIYFITDFYDLQSKTLPI